MAQMDDLTNAVARNTSAGDSVLQVLQGISQQLKDAQAQNNPAAIQSVIDQIDRNTNRLAGAVVQNTPAQAAETGGGTPQPGGGQPA